MTDYREHTELDQEIASLKGIPWETRPDQTYEDVLFNKITGERLPRWSTTGAGAAELFKEMPQAVRELLTSQYVAEQHEISPDFNGVKITIPAHDIAMAYIAWKRGASLAMYRLISG